MTPADVEVLPSPEIWHRDDFPLLCNWRKLWRAVEVGVDRAVWAKLFLARYQGHQWWGVDSWAPYGEMRYDREADYLTAIANLSPFSDRAKLIRGSSAATAAIFPESSIDFLYIDAAHDHKSVIADLRAWWPALSGQGILAGHDWTEQAIHEGVQRAVREFAAENGLGPVYLTAVEGYGREACPSWYVYRGGMPGADWRRC